MLQGLVGGYPAVGVFFKHLLDEVLGMFGDFLPERVRIVDLMGEYLLYGVLFLLALEGRLGGQQNVQ